MSPLQRRSPSWRSSLPKLLHGQPVWWRGFLGVPQQWHERSLPGSAGQCLFYLALPPSGYRTVTKKIHDTCVSQTEPYHHGEDLWEGPAYFQPAVWLHSLPVLWKPDLLHRPLPGQGGGPEPHGAEVLSTGSSGPIWNHDNIACTEPSRSHLALRAGGATSVNLGSSGRWCQIPSSRSCIWWPWRKPAYTNSDDIHDDRSRCWNVYQRCRWAMWSWASIWRTPLKKVRLPEGTQRTPVCPVDPPLTPLRLLCSLWEMRGGTGCPSYCAAAEPWISTKPRCVCSS